jgi:ATP-dependent Clp protease ATP-binding subunit ClpA
MFERFTASSRQVVVVAQEEARRFGHDWVGTEHLLLAVALQPDEWAALVLARRGLTAQRISSEIDRIIGRSAAGRPTVAPAIDGAALATLGIDLDAVRRHVEATFGPGALARKPGSRPFQHEPAALPFTPRAKQALALGVHESLDQRRHEVTPREIVIGLLGADGIAGQILREHGVDPAALRAPSPTASASPATRSSRTPRRLFGRRSDHRAS